MLTFVGIGPGDPELVTRKAARLLQEADAVALPETGRGGSAVMNIVGDLIGNKPLCPLHMPMEGKRENWKTAHEQAARQLLGWLEEYPHIVYPVLGDPSVYATSSYLLGLIAPVHPCQVVPGIPAMCAAAAQLRIPLCEQGQRLTVLDALGEDEPLPEGTAVLMKSGRKLREIQQRAAGREAYAVRNLGMDNAWAGRLEDVSGEDYSYFTTVIVR